MEHSLSGFGRVLARDVSDVVQARARAPRLGSGYQATLGGVEWSPEAPGESAWRLLRQLGGDAASSQVGRGAPGALAEGLGVLNSLGVNSDSALRRLGAGLGGLGAGLGGLTDNGVASGDGRAARLRRLLPGTSFELALGGLSLDEVDEGARDGVDTGAAAGLPADGVAKGAATGLPAGGRDAAGASWTLWGRGSASAFRDERAAGASLDGEVLSGYLGVDWRREGLLAGVALSRSEGRMNYAAEGLTGTVDTAMTSLHPYASWSPRDGVAVWAMLGVGEGGAVLADADGAAATDLGMLMAAAGASSRLGALGALDWTARADAFAVRTEAAGQARKLPAVAALARQLRVALEGEGRLALSGGSELLGAVEIGGRLDDGGSGGGALGAELGGRLAYVHRGWGLNVEARSRLARSAGYEERGASFTATFDPGAPRRGLRASLAPSWGTPDGGGVAALWEGGWLGAGGGAEALRGAEDVADGRNIHDPGMQMEAWLGYGIGVGEDGLLTPLGSTRTWGGDAKDRLGVDLSAPWRRLDVEIALYGERLRRGVERDTGVSLDTRLRRGVGDGQGGVEFFGRLRPGGSEVGVKANLRF